MRVKNNDNGMEIDRVKDRKGTDQKRKKKKRKEKRKPADKKK